MKILILFVIFMLICSSKSKENFEDFLQKKCVEYREKYEKVDKTNIQDEKSYYVIPAPGTSSAVNGVTVLPGIFPHMAALGYTTETEIDWVCGGTLISEKYVLTAAHCLKRRHKANIEEVEWVRLGVTKLSGKYGPYPKDYKIIQRIVHPSYEPPSKYNDIGLVQLDASTEIAKYIKPICLTTKTEKDFPEYVTAYTAIGWGLTKPNGNRSDALQLVELEFYPKEDCNEAYRTISHRLLQNGINQDQQICLGSSQYNPSDTCQGDSGGPLHIKELKFEYTEDYQLGIIAFGKSCGLKRSPGVYTRVSYYLPWIKSIVWPNE